MAGQRSPHLLGDAETPRRALLQHLREDDSEGKGGSASRE